LHGSLPGILTLVIWRIATSIAIYRALATTARLNVWRSTSLRNFALNASFFCADIASRWDPVAALPEQPRGISYARLDRLQRRIAPSCRRRNFFGDSCRPKDRNHIGEHMLKAT
jgi:hypothetical protein